MTIVVVQNPSKPPDVIKVNVPGLPGASGRSVELTKNATHIQWRLVGDSTWNNLVALSEITGPAGSGGSQDLSAYAKTADVQTLLNQKVATTRTITAGTGLTGGGDLTADRTIGVNFGTATGTVTQGNDSRLSNTRTPTDGTVTTAKLVDSAVTSAKIADGTIVNADISNTAAIAVSKITGLAPVATSGSYDDLINKPAAGSGGTVSDATASAKGVVQLAGDLTGSATVPTIANGVITSAKIADGTIVNADISNTAAIAPSKIAGLANVATTGSYSDLINAPAAGLIVDPDNESLLIPGAISSGTTTTINDGAITSQKLADNSVTSAKIVDGTIVNDDISATAAIAVAKIAGISTVGKTGSYDDLLNKPAAGSGGVSVTPDSSNTDALILETGVSATDSLVAGFVSSNGSATNTAVKNIATSGTSSTTSGYKEIYAPVGYWIAQTALNVGDATVPNGNLQLSSMFLAPGTYNAIGFRVNSGASSGAVMRVAVYTDLEGKPNNLVLQATTTDVTTSGFKQITGLSLVVPSPGSLYWVGVVTQNSPTTLPITTRIRESSSAIVWDGTPDLSYSPSRNFYVNGVTGSAPTQITTFNMDEYAARMAFRRSA